jgi:hypothetical protein
VNCQFPSSHFVDKKAQLSAKKHLILGPPQHLQRVLRDKLFRSGSHLNTSLQGISPASRVWHRRVPHSQIHPTITYHILGYHNLLSITHTIIYIYIICIYKNLIYIYTYIHTYIYIYILYFYIMSQHVSILFDG